MLHDYQNVVIITYFSPLKPHCRLVGGLASENVRWAESVENFREQEKTLCGDVLLISAFVSYVGYFTKKYRTELMDKYWIPYLNELKVNQYSTDIQPIAFVSCHWGKQCRLCIGLGICNLFPPCLIIP